MRNSLYYKLPKSQLSRLQHIHNSFACTVVKAATIIKKEKNNDPVVSPVVSLSSYTLSTGSRSLNALNTSSSHLATTFSQLPNLHTFITSSSFNVLALFALHPSFSMLPTSSLYLNDMASRCTPMLTIHSFIFMIKLSRVRDDSHVSWSALQRLRAG